MLFEMWLVVHISVLCSVVIPNRGHPAQVDQKPETLQQNNPYGQTGHFDAGANTDFMSQDGPLTNEEIARFNKLVQNIGNIPLSMDGISPELENRLSMQQGTVPNNQQPSYGLQGSASLNPSNGLPNYNPMQNIPGLSLPNFYSTMQNIPGLGQYFTGNNGQTTPNTYPNSAQPNFLSNLNPWQRGQPTGFNPLTGDSQSQQSTSVVPSGSPTNQNGSPNWNNNFGSPPTNQFGFNQFKPQNSPFSNFRNMLLTKKRLHRMINQLSPTEAMHLLETLQNNGQTNPPPSNSNVPSRARRSPETSFDSSNMSKKMSHGINSLKSIESRMSQSNSYGHRPKSEGGNMEEEMSPEPEGTESSESSESQTNSHETHESNGSQSSESSESQTNSHGTHGSDGTQSSESSESQTNSHKTHESNGSESSESSESQTSQEEQHENDGTESNEPNESESEGRNNRYQSESSNMRKKMSAGFNGTKSVESSTSETNSYGARPEGSGSEPGIYESQRTRRSPEDESISDSSSSENTESTESETENREHRHESEQEHEMSPGNGTENRESMESETESHKNRYNSGGGNQEEEMATEINGTKNTQSTTSETNSYTNTQSSNTERRRRASESSSENNELTESKSDSYTKWLESWAADMGSEMSSSSNSFRSSGNEQEREIGESNEGEQSSQNQNRERKTKKYLYELWKMLTDKYYRSNELRELSSEEVREARKELTEALEYISNGESYYDQRGRVKRHINNAIELLGESSKIGRALKFFAQNYPRQLPTILEIIQKILASKSRHSEEHPGEHPGPEQPPRQHPEEYPGEHPGPEQPPRQHPEEQFEEQSEE